MNRFICVKVQEFGYNRLQIGMSSENDYRKIIVDCSAWLKDFPNGIIRFIYKRPDGVTYAYEAVHDSANFYSWSPTSNDTAVSGYGSLEVQMIDNDVVALSAVAVTYVSESLSATTEPPPVYPNWVEEVFTKAEQVIDSSTHPPYIDEETGTWFVYDLDEEEFVDTEIPATGPTGQTGPRGIKGDTGNSGVYIGSTEPEDESVKVWIDNSTENTNILKIKSEGESWEPIESVIGPVGPIGPRGPQGEAGTGFIIKGYYDTLEELEENVPDPETGDAYGIGATYPYNIYTWDGVNEEWVDNGSIQGPRGYAATIEIGNVTTTDPSVPATVVNSGTENEAIFDFTIPRGPQGIQGETGSQGLKGDTGETGVSVESASLTADYKLKVVLDNGEEFVSEESLRGPQGIKGDTGDTGPRGASATISVGTVTGGTTASVVNAGTSANAIFNFVIPKGDKGDTGEQGPAGSDASVTQTNIINALGFTPANSANLNTHINNVSNPHSVTASQVGAAVQEDIDEAIDSLTDSSVVTGTEVSYADDEVVFTESKVNIKTGNITTSSYSVNLADSSNAGMMSPASVNAIQTHTSQIAALQGRNVRLLYTASQNPTAQQIQDFVISQGYGEQSGWSGIAVVVNVTYHIWHCYTDTEGAVTTYTWKDDGQDTVSTFTNSIAGIIKGSELDGKVYAEDDGTGSVVGWDDLNSEVVYLEENKVGFTDYASSSTSGVVLVDSSNGIEIDTNHKIKIVPATSSDITAKTSSVKSIVPSVLDLAIEKSLGNNSLTWTDVETASARATIGIEEYTSAEIDTLWGE